MPDLSMEERLRRTVAGDAAIIAILTKAVADTYGAKGLNILKEAIEREFPPILRHIGRQIGANVENGDATDWAKIEKYVSEMSGTELEIKATSTSAVIKALSCPRAEQYRRIFPDFCRLVFIGMERAIASAVNPALEVWGEKSIPNGDEYCEIRCQLKQ